MSKLLSLKDFLKESEEYQNGGLTVFDIDDTLFRTTAKIAVYDTKLQKVTRELSTSEYNSYKLKQGEVYDYKQFKDAAKFYKESVPIAKMMAKAKAILANSIKNPLSRVIIITARNNFDHRDKFLATFRKYGFDIDKVRVERAGMIGDIDVPAIKKMLIIRAYLMTKRFARVRMIDDDMNNLREFLKMKRMFPTIQFSAYLALEDGSIRTIKQ